MWTVTLALIYIDGAYGRRRTGSPYLLNGNRTNPNQYGLTHSRGNDKTRIGSPAPDGSSGSCCYLSGKSAGAMVR